MPRSLTQRTLRDILPDEVTKQLAKLAISYTHYFRTKRKKQLFPTRLNPSNNLTENFLKVEIIVDKTRSYKN